MSRRVATRVVLAAAVALAATRGAASPSLRAAPAEGVGATGSAGPAPPALRSPASPDAGADVASAAVLRALTTGDDEERRRVLRELGPKPTTATLRAIVARAPEQSPAIRREIGQALERLGERAVPALIVEWRIGASPAVRRFAGAQLEAMEKSMPGEAIQVKSPELLAEVLRAYGTAHDMDALGVVLSFANADRETAREAARQALLDYGAPATGKLREAWATFMNRPAPDEWTTDKLARELFAAFDRDRRREMYTLHEDGLAALSRAQEARPPSAELLAKATESFDRILARAPDFERRREMAPAYVLLAKALEERDPDRAEPLYKKARDLDPASARGPQIESALLALEARRLRLRGVRDEDALRRAVELDPANAMAQSELQRFADQRNERADRFALGFRIASAVCAGGAVLLALLLLKRRLARS